MKNRGIERLRQREGVFINQGSIREADPVEDTCEGIFAKNWLMCSCGPGSQALAQVALYSPNCFFREASALPVRPLSGTRPIQII